LIVVFILGNCVKTSDFDYTLPSELIAQVPIESRDQSRLLVTDRRDGSISHRRFFEITDYLHEGDVLVFNDSRVVPARLKGKRPGSGGKVEVLLLRRRDDGLWETLVKPARRLLPGAMVEFTVASAVGRKLTAEVKDTGEGGVRIIEFSDEALLMQAGEIPLPPYIHTPLAQPERYQTVYARADGSAAAPTAGLHFTPELLEKIRGKGVDCRFVTLHVGLDTFRPVKEEDPTEHIIYREYGVLNKEVAGAITRAKNERRRVIGVGTTTVRILEKAAQVGRDALIDPFEGWVDLFILPGYQFKIVDALVTNFHLPRSTLLMLVAAFGGKELVDRAYQAAIAERYRFYSFGDAMLIL
jgi:S-adenosylmethionine:tRNA ribosyltransferase-isomerase